MAPRVNRGESWLYTFGLPDKRRPVLVLSRQKAIDPLRTLLRGTDHFLRPWSA